MELPSVQWWRQALSCSTGGSVLVSCAVAHMAMEFKELENKDPILEYVVNLKLNWESLNGVKVALV